MTLCFDSLAIRLRSDNLKHLIPTPVFTRFKGWHTCQLKIRSHGEFDCSWDRNSPITTGLVFMNGPLSYQNLPSLHRRENLACYHFWRSFFGPNRHFRRSGLFQNWRTNSAACSSMLWCSVWELLSRHDLQFCSGLRIRQSRSKGWEWSHSCWKMKHSKYNDDLNEN